MSQGIFMSGFHLLYQPKIKGEHVVALEALLRPTDSQIPLNQYLAAIENTIALDLAVLERCLADRQQFALDLPVSINIHPLSLEDEYFIEKAIECAAHQNITFELVEYQHIEISQHLVNNISQLKWHGIKVSVDDFGKDFARADLALSIGASEVKFDRSLIRDIDTNYIKFKHLLFLCSKIKTLCTHNIVFEGVENRRQKELIELIVDDPIIQGFYFYQPMELASIAKLDCLKAPSYQELIDTPLNLGLDLDFKLYNFLVENEIEELESPQVNDFIKQHDVLGLVYNQDVKKTLSNLRNIYFNSASVIGNGVMSLIDATEKLVIMRNQDGVAVYDNLAHQELVGASIVGTAPQDIIAENAAYEICLKKDQIVLEDDSLMFHKDTEFFDGVGYETIREKMVYNDNKFVITSICPSDSGLMDVSRDELTHCYTRSFLKYHLDSYQGRTVAFLDMNGFKAINDRFGHKVGDQCLMEFSAQLKGSLREKDVVIRYGGDEFVVIFDHAVQRDIEKRLILLNQQMTQEFAARGYQLSFAYGTAVVTEQGIEQAIEEADRAMYTHKSQIKRGLLN
ncbi:diguanylate cyclase [Vibrio ponticus]|uniref:Diguanylate cyclase n=2 Tax=Vibrio ponticus TaxID=265668 RepID=A0ABX3FK13_9VIBR|nr:diguanylate cyclase [Vibrio ponticus]